ncbi:MAG: DUF58 domain-containing protein [Spirochaetales bacterium]|nr:DUF58 domain-containing protein [Spirochaetales bacterium]
MKYWPFSPTGGFLLFSSLALLGISLPREQGYGIFISLFFLVYLTFTLVRLLVFAFSFEKDRFQWRVSWNYALSRSQRKHMHLAAPLRAPWGTAYCFVVKGKLMNRDETLYYKRDQKVFSHEASYGIPLALPGLFHCKGRLYLSDLFGLLRFPLNQLEHREVAYYPPVLSDRAIPASRSSEENEEVVKSNPSNPEKLLMREYQPGDLVRDINWKASGKFTAIYTRISPDQEQTVSRITLVLRPEGTKELPSLEGEALLLGVKSLGLTFFKTLRRDRPESLMEIIMGDRVFLSTEENFEEAFISSLTALGPKESGPAGELPEGALVITTSADREYGRLKAVRGERVFLCSCSRGGGKDLDYSVFEGNGLPGKRIIMGLFKKTPVFRDSPPAVEVGVLL